jgi:hypothetical protein
MTAIPPGTHPRVAEFARGLGAEFPRFRLIARERSPLMRALHAVVRLWNPGFLDHMTTTLAYRVYAPASVRSDPVHGVRTLRHEAVHLRQFRDHPVWLPLSYALLLPAGITMRARWEMEAYVETMRAELEDTGSVPDSTLDWIEGLFTGPAYLFMDVRRGRVRRRLREARSALMWERSQTGGTSAG